MLEQMHQIPALLPGQIVDLFVGRDLREPHHHRDHLLRQKVAQRVAEIVVCVLSKVREEPLVQLSLLKRRA